MAEPPKPKRPSPGKKAPEPDFSPFKNWLINGPAGKWPESWETDKDLSPKQMEVVDDNAKLLWHRDAWLKKVQAFEAALAALDDEARQKKTRTKYYIRFDRHVFADGDKDFSDYPFPCSVSFRGATFGESYVSFGGATFGEGDVSFDRATFGEGYVSFGGATFGKGDVSFNGATFGEGSVSFGGATFGKGDVGFTGATFGEGSVSFVGATFGEGDVWFTVATFGEGYVSFVGATFGKGDVSFGGATFGEGDVSFEGATFGEGDVWFREATFGEGHVSFGGATFGEGNVGFTGATFGEGNVSFGGATFGEGNVSFTDIDFRSTTMYASGMAVAGNLYVKSHFPEAVNFSRLDVKGTASFSGSSFAKVPDFRDAKFDRPPEVAGMVVPRPELDGRTRLAADGNDVAKFRKLKAMALAANDHEKDGEFFAGEMLAKRGTETTSRMGLLFNTLYWRISDFGQSFMLPLWWLFGSFLAFTFANFVVLQSGISATSVTSAARVDAFVFSAFLSLKNSVPLLGSLFRFAQAPENHKSWFQSYYDTLLDQQSAVDWLIGLGVVQNIFGGVLLFLFLLALRNKFRLK